MIKVKLNSPRTIEGLNGETVLFRSGEWVVIKPKWVLPALSEQFRQILWEAGLTIIDQNDDVIDFSQINAEERWLVWTRAMFYLQKGQ